MLKPQAIYFSHGWEGLDQNSRGQTLAQTYGFSLGSATYLLCDLGKVTGSFCSSIYLFGKWKENVGKIGVCLYI